MSTDESAAARYIARVEREAASDLAQLDKMTSRSLRELPSPSAADSHRSPRSAPEPLRRPVPPPEPYPVGELGPILAPACEAMRRVIQAPDAVCGASLLAAASLAVQGLANVEIDGRTLPLSLWFL